MGSHITEEKVKLYVFLVNGQRREIREHALKEHPGCFKILPQRVKDEIKKNRAWLAQVL